MGSFVAVRLSALPAALNGPNGQAWATALGGAQDDEQAVARVAGLSRYIDRAPDDALDVVGQAYQRARSPRETVDSAAYRTRLGEAWPFWESAPLLAGFADVAAPYVAAPYALEWSNNATGACDGLKAWFSRVWGIWIGTMLADDVWGDPDDAGNDSAWGDGGLWGLRYTPNEADGGTTAWTAPSFGVADLDWLRREIRLCKPGGAYPVTIAVGTALDAQGWSAIWGDGGLWGDGGVWGDPSPISVVYLALAHVWGEEKWYGGGPGLWGAPGDTWESFEPPSGGW